MSLFCKSGCVRVSPKSHLKTRWEFHLLSLARPKSHIAAGRFVCRAGVLVIGANVMKDSISSTTMGRSSDSEGYGNRRLIRPSLTPSENHRPEKEHPRPERFSTAKTT